MEMLLVSSPVDIGDVQGSQVYRKEVCIGLESCVRLCHLLRKVLSSVYIVHVVAARAKAWQYVYLSG
jgi:hypothetical protein